MAIQNRRGQAVDFVPSKMLPGEFAVSLDNRKLYMCFASGTVKEVALTDDVTQTIATASTSLGGRIAVLESASTEQGAALFALVTRMGTAEAAIRSHDGRLVVLENDGTNIKARLSDVESETATLDELLTDLNLNMITISNDVEGLKSNAVRFDTVQNKSAAQKLQARENTDSAGIASLATAYSSSARYAVGDMVTYDGKLYTCKTAITTAEAWDSSHWTEVTVGDQLSDLKDDLTDIQEEIENIEPLSDNAVVALLACFQNVAWTTPESQSYYDALEEALYEGRRKLESISATYTATGHTVYPWDTLDSLRPYIIVTVTYNDGTTKSVFDYNLTGDLTSSTSTVEVAYGEKTTQISVTVDSTMSLQYYIQNGTVVDSTIVDTGVKLADTNKSVSIVADITDEEIVTRVRSMFFMSDRNASIGLAQWQLSCISPASGTDYLKNYIAIAVGSVGMRTGDKDNTAHRIKFAMIHYSNTTNYTLYLKVDDTVIYDFQSVVGSYMASEQSLHIGGRPDGGYFWKGTVNLFGVYFRGMPTSEARTILGVE